MLGCELDDFLNTPDCWDKIIEISYKLWEKDMPDSSIKKLFIEYDRNKEAESQLEVEENKEKQKFNNSFSVISQDSNKNPLGSNLDDTISDDLDDRMNVMLDTDMQTDEKDDNA